LFQECQQRTGYDAMKKVLILPSERLHFDYRLPDQVAGWNSSIMVELTTMLKGKQRGLVRPTRVTI
jgi:hypothetical protein